LTTQPLHKSCDSIYASISILEGLEYNLNNGQIVSVYKQVNDVLSKLKKSLGVIREQALMTEGDYEG